MRNTKTQATKFVAWSSDQELTSVQDVNAQCTSRIAKMNHLLPCI